MMNQEKYKEYMAMMARCPYGRDAIVGTARCINCYFNKLDSNRCDGDKEKVKAHMRKLGLDY